MRRSLNCDIVAAFTPYTSGVPDKVCDFVGCSYTLHQKNHTKVRFFLHDCKFFTTFATANQKFADICYKKRLLYLGIYSSLDNLNFYLSEIQRNAHVYTWAFLHILEIDRSRDLNEPIAVGSRFLCTYVKTNKIILTN